MFVPAPLVSCSNYLVFVLGGVNLSSIVLKMPETFRLRNYSNLHVICSEFSEVSLLTKKLFGEAPLSDFPFSRFCILGGVGFAEIFDPVQRTAMQIYVKNSLKYRPEDVSEYESPPKYLDVFFAETPGLSKL